MTGFFPWRQFALRSTQGNLTHKTSNDSIDDDVYDEDSKMTTEPLSPRSTFDYLFGGEVLLFEALPYLDVASIVDKRIVCRQWKEECDVAIDNKGGKGKKSFVKNADLRDAVRRYCNGNLDEIEKVVGEYGYPIGNWDVSRVEDFSRVFHNLGSFNEDISAWDVGNATNMTSMFHGAQSFNQSLLGWDVSNVTDMRSMFGGAHAFNGDVSTWNTSNVNNMSSMFFNALAFNGDVSAWNTSNVTNMTCMFHQANDFNGDLSAWDTSSLTHPFGYVK